MDPREHLTTAEAANTVYDRRSDTTAKPSDPTTGLGGDPGPLEDLRGSVLGGYLLQEVIGAGGGGRVYMAQHCRMDRIVALKIFSRGMLGDAVQVKRFYREVRAAAKLIHPNIVMAYDAGEDRALHYLVMEYVDGSSLANLVRQTGPLPVRQATEYVLQVAKGLAYSHEAGIIHRDVKPDNIMVDRAGTVKLLDMGLARLQGLALQQGSDGEASALTSQGIVIGTVSYISPEQIIDASAVDERSDIYSLACTFYYLLAGHAPYKGSILEVFRAHADAPVPMLKDLPGDIPHGLDSVFRRMMAKDLKGRIASARELVSLLEPFCTAHGWQNTEPPVVRRQDAGADALTAAAAEAIGFDLATKYAYLSSFDENGEPVLLKDPQGALATPAALLYRRGSLVAGGAAVKIAKGRPEGFLDRLACRLGAIDSPSVEIDGSAIPNEALVGVLVTHLCPPEQQAARPAELCYTVPSCHGEAQRRAYRDAFFLGLGREATPVSASAAVAVQFSFLHGWLNPQRSAPPKRLLVFRCGDSSFDATVFRLENRALTSQAIVSDPTIGEASWDRRITELLLSKVDSKLKARVLEDAEQSLLLQRQVDSAKAALARGEAEAMLQIRAEGEILKQSLSYHSLGAVGEDILQQLEAHTNQVLNEAGLTWSDLDHVLLAGSGARLPFVSKAVKRWSGDREIFCLAGPEVPSGGAALVAENRRGVRHETLDFRIQDVTAHGYGIRSRDQGSDSEKVAEVIARNTPLPAAARVSVAKTNARQSEIEFDVVEFAGGRADAASILGTSRIANLPPGMPVGAAIEVELNLDAHGILSIAAISLATGRRSTPDYRAVVGMLPEERASWRSWLERLA